MDTMTIAVCYLVNRMRLILRQSLTWAMSTSPKATGNTNAVYQELRYVGERAF